MNDSSPYRNTTHDETKDIKGNSKKISSIRRKLYWQVIRSKIGANTAFNIFLVAVLSIGWIVMTEAQHLGGYDHSPFSYKRELFLTENSLDSVTYSVSQGGEELFHVKAYVPIVFIVSILIMAIFFQLMNLIFSSYSIHRRIQKTLKPLNELALKADEISRMSFDGTKYHKIEDALTSISPDDVHAMKLGDEDLRGIEMAMNNLIRRMHDTYEQQTRFVDDASHELRTPIAVIQGYANMLDRWGKTDEEVLEESITAIKNETDHMSHLVEQLLFLARGDNGRNVMHFETVHPEEMVREIYEESLMIDEDHKYSFISDSGDSSLSISADISMLKQSVRILVDNAAKYTKKGDEIALSVGQTKDGHAYIQVQDSGIGMSEKDVQHMFERFYRSDDIRDIQGTGLGLSIAKWIIDKHEGHFEILSREGLGTRIRIILPKKHP